VELARVYMPIAGVHLNNFKHVTNISNTVFIINEINFDFMEKEHSVRFEND
jgi:hypothetical protein